MFFEWLLPFVLALAAPILGFVYASAGERKRKMMSRSGLGQVTGFGSWFAFNVNTRKRTVVYFWTVFFSTYVIFILAASASAPAMVADSILFASFGLLTSTVGAVVTESVLHRVDAILGQSDDSIPTSRSNTERH